MDDLFEVVKKRKWIDGYKVGFRRGVQLGIKESKIEFVKCMNEEGLSVEEIAKCLYMPVEEVELYI